MVSLPAFGRRTSARHIALPKSCAPERCGSTATTFSTPPCPLADTSNPAGGERWVKTRSSFTPKSKPSAPCFDFCFEKLWAAQAAAHFLFQYLEDVAVIVCPQPNSPRRDIA